MEFGTDTAHLLAATSWEGFAEDLLYQKRVWEGSPETLRLQGFLFFFKAAHKATFAWRSLRHANGQSWKWLRQKKISKHPFWEKRVCWEESPIWRGAYPETLVLNRYVRRGSSRKKSKRSKPTESIEYAEGTGNSRIPAPQSAMLQVHTFETRHHLEHLQHNYRSNWSPETLKRTELSRGNRKRGSF